jgi:hypothetical protein
MRIGWGSKNYFTAETQRAPRKHFWNLETGIPFSMGNNDGATDSKSALMGIRLTHHTTTGCGFTFVSLGHWLNPL